VLDTFAKTPLDAHVLNTHLAPTIMVVGTKAPRKKIEVFRKMGAEVLKIPATNGLIDIKALMRVLGKKQITSVLIEGGGEVAASAINAKIVDKAYFFIAPKIFGGRDAKTPVEGDGVLFPIQARWLKNVQTEKVGKDLLVTGYL